MKTEKYTTGNVEILLGKRYLTIRTKKSIEEVRLHKSMQLANGSIWTLTAGGTEIGIHFDDRFPKLYQGSVTEHRKGDFNSLRIPLVREEVSSDMYFYMRKERYRRPEWVRQYIRSRQAA